MLGALVLPARSMPDHRVSLSFYAFPLSEGTEAGGASVQRGPLPEGEVGGEERVFQEVENVMLALPHQRGS